MKAFWRQDLCLSARDLQGATIKSTRDRKLHKHPSTRTLLILYLLKSFYILQPCSYASFEVRDIAMPEHKYMLKCFAAGKYFVYYCQNVSLLELPLNWLAQQLMAALLQQQGAQGTIKARKSNHLFR